MFWGVMGTVLVSSLGLIDYVSGKDYNIEFFYLVPIFLATWYAGRRVGLAMAAASVLAWFSANPSNGFSPAGPRVYIWNTLIRLSSFVVVCYLLSALRQAYIANRQLARTDYVTKAVSVGYFYELAQLEIHRFQRYQRAFTCAYIDLDDFKHVNDRLGHTVGDKVLRAVTKSIQCQIRPVDIFARLGGDEFILLLPETGGEEAKKVMARIHSSLTDEMAGNDWKVTFSVGVVTYLKSPVSVDGMVKVADDVMYSVKTNSKNGIRYSVITD